MCPRTKSVRLKKSSNQYGTSNQAVLLSLKVKGIPFCISFQFSGQLLGLTVVVHVWHVATKQLAELHVSVQILPQIDSLSG